MPPRLAPGETRRPPGAAAAAATHSPAGVQTKASTWSTGIGPESVKKPLGPMRGSVSLHPGAAAALAAP